MACANARFSFTMLISASPARKNGSSDKTARRWLPVACETNPKVNGIDGATRSYVEYLYEVARGGAR